MSYKQQMTSTIVKVIWADFGSISYPLERLFLILWNDFFNASQAYLVENQKGATIVTPFCGADETRRRKRRSMITLLRN